MIDPPTITQTNTQPAAVIRLAVPPEDLPKVMKPGINEVRATVEAQGIKPAGPWFSHYQKMEPRRWEFEIGLPVKTPIAPAGRVTPGELPARKVARAIHHGGYEGLHESWGEFSNWIKSQGLTPDADLWECYVVGPDSGPDATKWRTELNRPVR